MARKTVPVTTVSRDGALRPNVTPVLQTEGFTFSDNDGNVWVEIENTSGGSVTLTPRPQLTVGGLSIAPDPKGLLAGSVYPFGPYPPAVYGTDPEFDVSGNVGVRAYRF